MQSSADERAILRLRLSLLARIVEMMPDTLVMSLLRATDRLGVNEHGNEQDDCNPLEQDDCNQGE